MLKVLLAMHQKPEQSCFQRLYDFDQRILAAQTETKLLIGCDEVGRGSMIGPVVAAAVSFKNLNPHQTHTLAEINDSKQLKPEVRHKLSQAILTCAHVGVGEASQQEVDSLNVHQASLLAMYRAISMLLERRNTPTASSVFDLLNLPHPERESLWRHCQPFQLEPDMHLLIDGRSLIKDLPRHQQQPVIKGDGQSACIAAASIIAKTYRDSLIAQYAEKFPDYGWTTNMGYPTPTHQQAIQQLGVTPLHRKNYKPVKEARQLSLITS